MLELHYTRAASVNCDDSCCVQTLDEKFSRGGRAAGRELVTEGLNMIRRYQISIELQLTSFSLTVCSCLPVSGSVLPDLVTCEHRIRPTIITFGRHRSCRSFRDY